MITAQKLNIFWRHANVPKKWKLIVYNAVVISQLVFGLNTIKFTNPMLNKLDAFQIRGLRAILNIEHSYKSHVSYKRICRDKFFGIDFQIAPEFIVFKIHVSATVLTSVV